jgi:hypothetical protein
MIMIVMMPVRAPPVHTSSPFPGDTHLGQILHALVPEVIPPKQQRLHLKWKIEFKKKLKSLV